MAYDSSEIDNSSFPMVTTTSTTAPVSQKWLGFIYIISSMARPFMMYAFTLIFVMVSITMCALLITQKEKLVDSSGILLTILGLITPMVSLALGARSWEKIKGKTMEAVVKDNATVVMAPNATTVTTPTSPPVTSEVSKSPIETLPAPDDPLLELAAMDLSEFVPKPADDHPVIEN